MVKRWVLAVAVVAALIVAVFVRQQQTADQSSEKRYTFCLVLRDPVKARDAVERALRGVPEPGDQDVRSLEATLGLFWGDDVARGGPTSTDDDAIILVRAVRRAVADEDPSIVASKQVVQAADRMAPTAAKACHGVIRRQPADAGD